MAEEFGFSNLDELSFFTFHVPSQDISSLLSTRNDHLEHPQSYIKNIPTENYISIDEIKDKDLFCSICRNVMDNVCIVSPCCHKFCYECIIMCRKRNSFTCPLCRCHIANLNI